MVGYILGMIMGSTAIVLAIATLIFFFVRDKKFKANIRRIGSTAETQINNDLQTWAKHTHNYFINSSLYKYNDNKVFEVDSILITDKALIVIEIKSIRGKIEGDSKGKTWVKVLGETKHAIANPILQNDKHIEHITQATKLKVPTISLIIFSNRAHDLAITNLPSHVILARHAELFDKLDEIHHALPVMLTAYDIKTLGAAIKSYRTTNRSDLNLHRKITRGVH